jgi:type I restriction enzyme S subunit
MVVEKDFIQTEAGFIPKNWVVKKLGEISDIIGGGTPSTSVNKYWEGEINWFTPTEVGYEKYLFESKRKLTQAGLSNSSARILQPGTILMTSRAGIGDLGILKVEAATNQGFQSIFPFTTVDNEFLYYLMLTKKNVLLQNASGSTFLEISPSKVKSIYLAIPPKKEQTVIATALSDMDALIAQTEKLIEKRKAIKQGVMQELLRPKEGWVMKKFTDVVDYIHGKAHEQYIVEDGKYKVVNSKFISSDGEVVKYSNTSFLTAKENDILTVLSDLPNGKALAKCFLVDQNNLYAVNQRICIWRTKGADPLYLYYILNRHAYFLQLDDGVTQTHILNGDINKFELSIIEDVQKQREIGIILRDIDNEINILENKNGKLQLQKQGMMQVLLTGKIRLI